MKTRTLSMITAAMMVAVSANARASEVKDLDINVVLNADGSAQICERWDVDIWEGTEWYLVRSNLGDIEISGLSVTENGRKFIFEGEWDMDRGLEEKAFRCGIVSKRDGCELCWGLGSHGRHEFTVKYLMSNMVKSLDDCDMVHMQFVSPGISPSPEHVKLTISSPCMAFEPEVSRVWGFGYEGTAEFSGDGSLIFESSENFRRTSSMIALVRMDKGAFHSPSVQSRSFEEVLDTAMEGSDWEDSEEKDAWGIIVGFLACLGAGIWLLAHIRRRTLMEVLGVTSIKEIPWSRDIPFGGDLLCSEYALEKIGKADTGNKIAAAMILRMINDGNLSVIKEPDSSKVELCFGTRPEDGAEAVRELYDMMKEASGEDMVLQNREFGRWSKKHKSRVHNWVNSLPGQGRQRLISGGYLVGGRNTEESKANGRTLIGLKKFLSDNTLSNERSSSEVILWKDYLVFAALFGIADKVAKELRDINPQAFEEVMPYEHRMMSGVLYQAMSLSNAITNTNMSYMNAQSASGGGGFSSFGGGGGFSGGGFGGGAR